MGLDGTQHVQIALKIRFNSSGHCANITTIWLPKIVIIPPAPSEKLYYSQQVCNKVFEKNCTHHIFWHAIIYGNKCLRLVLGSVGKVPASTLYAQGSILNLAQVEKTLSSRITRACSFILRSLERHTVINGPIWQTQCDQ